MNTDKQYEELQAIGKSAAESIAGMVAALECDYDRLAELRGHEHYECGSCGAFHPVKFKGDCRDDANRVAESDDYISSDESEELAELEETAGECKDRQEAEQYILENPLGVQVRTGWYIAGEHQPVPEEFEILLGTGGPATRIIGDVGEDYKPLRARLQAQNWGTPWTDYTGDAISQDDLLTYCRCFYFGED